MTFNFGLLALAVLGLAAIALWAMWKWAPREITCDVWRPACNLATARRFLTTIVLIRDSLRAFES
jgi:hypothetical protein